MILVKNIVWRKTKLNTSFEKKKNCGDDEQCSLSKVQRKNYKIGVKQTRTFTKVRDRIRFNGGVIYPLLTGHTDRVLLVVIGKNGKKISRQFYDYLWHNNKYEKPLSAFDKEEDCICWQDRFIDHITYEMMTAIETVDSLVLSIASFQNCSYVNMTLRIESTERRKLNMQVRVYVLLYISTDNWRWEN